MSAIGFTINTINLLRESKIGNNNPQWKGGKTKTNCLTCKKRFEYYPTKNLGKYCSRKCMGKNPDYLKKQREVKLGKVSKLKGIKRIDLSGNNHWNWQGGLTTKYPRSQHLNGTYEYKSWRKKVFERDNYTCKDCGFRGYLEAHHVMSYAKYPELRYNVDNGLTLCRECHKKTNNYTGKGQILSTS